MKISRMWAMPSCHTFTIKPIKQLLDKYIRLDGLNWIDPFAGYNSPAKTNNDINPKTPTKYHMDAFEFLKQQKSEYYAGAIYDPPYSTRQLKECYDNLGISMTSDETRSFWKRIRIELSRIVRPKGIIISCGWNSIGMGKNRGFKMIELLLVCHGANHNDTICVVERKIE